MPASKDVRFQSHLLKSSNTNRPDSHKLSLCEVTLEIITQKEIIFTHGNTNIILIDTRIQGQSKLFIDCDFRLILRLPIPTQICE